MDAVLQIVVPKNFAVPAATANMQYFGYLLCKSFNLLRINILLAFSLRPELNFLNRGH